MASNETTSSILFLDTNILLHFKSLREIDWLTVAGAKAVRLVICSPVLDELDDHKYNPRLKDRAEAADGEIQRIENAGYEVRNGVTLDVLVEPPEPDGNQDGGIIRRVQQYRDESPGTRVAVVTGDSNMGRRCRVRGVEVVRLGKEWMQPVEDERDRKFRQLQQEHQQLKNHQPDLQLLIAHGPDGQPTKCLDVDLVRPRPLDLQRVLGDVREIYEKHGLLGRYNSIHKEALEEFFAEYERNWLQLECFQAVRVLTLPLVFWLSNMGGAPATTVEVTVEFPHDFVCMISEEDIRKRYFRPRIQEQFDELHQLPRGISMFGLPQHVYVPNGTSREIEEPEFAKRLRESLRATEISRLRLPGIFEDIHRQGCFIVMNSPQAMHNKQHYFGTVFVTLTDWDSVRPFELKYQIRTANHPKLIEGKIVVRPKVTAPTPNDEAAVGPRSGEPA